MQAEVVTDGTPIPGTEYAMADTTSEVRTVLDRRSEAAWAKDIDRLMALYAPEVVYYDVVPPLQYVGSGALRDRFLHWFDGWTSPIGLAPGEVTIQASGDVAAAHMLIRASGTLRTGRDVDYWVRASNSLRRSEHGWLITHEHISLPIELPAGTAVMDLEPDSGR